MNNSPVDAERIRKWISAGSADSAAVVPVAEIRETPVSVVADYETPSRIGRVSFWFAGYCELEIWAFEGQVYFRFVEEDIDSPVLRDALREFFEELAK